MPRTATVRSVPDFKAAVAQAIHGGGLATIVAKVEATGPTSYVRQLSLLENRFQFHRYIQSRRRQ
jgi:hypothetical protein